MLERERIIEIVVAVIAVLLMIATMMWVGANYSDNGGLTDQGGELLVGTIVGFVVLMLIIGVVLAFVTNEPDDGLDEETESQNAA